MSSSNAPLGPGAAAAHASLGASEMLVAIREDISALRMIASRASVKPDDERDLRELAAHLDLVALWLSSRAISENVAKKRAPR